MRRLDATRVRLSPLAAAGSLGTAITLVLIGPLSATSLAATRSWDTGGGADTAWTTDANWNPNIEPGASDTAQFDRGAASTYTVTFPVLLPSPGDITTDRLIVGSNAVTFEPDHSSTDYIASQPTTIEADPILGMPVRGITIGAEANDTAAALTTHLGLLSTAAATLGHVAGSSGTLTLNQNNDQFNVTGSSAGDTELIIGRYGTGVLSVSGGADVRVLSSNGDSVVGLRAGSTGTATVSGTGSTWSNGTQMVIGNSGNGTMNLSAAGIVSNSLGYVGLNAGSVGLVTVNGNGTTWTNTDQLIVGYSGQGTLQITGGGHVVGNTTYIAYHNLAIGSALIDGAGSNWTVNGDLYVSHLASQLNSATMTVSNGGQVSSTNGIVAESLGAWGTVTVSGAGSAWNMTQGLYVGQYFGARGTLNINGGGQVTNNLIRIGDQQGSNGEVYVDGVGSTWTNNSSLTVGNFGRGSLHITGGAHVNAASASIGRGNVVVDSSGSLWNITNGLIAGRADSSTLDVTNGGMITAGAFSRIGVSADNASIIVIVDGPGSALAVNAPLQVYADAFSFEGPTVRLNIRNGGHISSIGDSEFLGSGYGGYVGDAAVSVDGTGSAWTIDGQLLVANYVIALSPLIISNGGSVTSDTAVIDGLVPVYVSGAGSRFDVDGELGIAWTSAGSSLHVSNGAQVSSAEGYVSRKFAGLNPNGSVTVDGAGSAWTVTNNLYVGYDAPGTLTVTNGGTVEAGNQLVVNPLGVLRGSGNVVGNVVNNGQVSPGTSPGILSINGNYIQSSTSKLLIDLAANSSYDQLYVTGNISLAGALKITLSGTFSPSFGDTFNIFDFDTVAGTFSTIDLPQLLDPIDWDTTRLYTEGILFVSGPPVYFGDYSQNGVVDAADYVVWRDSTPGAPIDPYTGADGNGNGFIDAGDYNVWRAHFGQTAGSGSASNANAAVPEPATLLQIILVTAVVSTRQRRTD